jgi:hypothetical protein
LQSLSLLVVVGLDLGKSLVELALIHYPADELEDFVDQDDRVGEGED